MNLSEQAEALATRLHVLIGPGGAGIGPDTHRLMDLWQGEEPELLRPAIEELLSNGFIDVEFQEPLPEARTDEAEQPAQYRIDDIAGVVVLEPLQSYFNTRSAAARQQAM